MCLFFSKRKKYLQKSIFVYHPNATAQGMMYRKVIKSWALFYNKLIIIQTFVAQQTYVTQNQCIYIVKRYSWVPD